MENYPKKFADSLKLVKGCLDGVGLYIFDEPTKTRNFLMKKLKFPLIYVFFISFPTLLLLQFKVTLQKGEQTVADGINAIAGLVIHLQDFIKILSLHYRKADIKLITDKISDLWPKPEELSTDSKISAYMHRNLRRMHLFTYGITFFTIFSLTCFMMSPFFTTIFHRVFIDPDYPFLYPLNIYFPFEVNSFYRYVIATCIYIIPICSYIGYATSDLLLVITLASHTSSLLGIIAIELKSVFEMDNHIKQMNQSQRTKYLMEKMKSIIAKHHNVLTLSDNLRRTVAFNIFVSLSTSSMSTCCFMFLSMKTVKIDRIRNILVALNMVIYMFNYSWPGQLLFENSSEIATAAYNSAWYEVDIKLQKYIHLLMMRCYKPCVLTSMGFYIVSFTSFSKTISTAWSYLSLLRHIYQD